MKSAGQVSMSMLRAQATAGGPGIPVRGGFTAKMQNKSQSGAVLVTDGSISWHQAGPPGAFEEWMDANLPAILGGGHGSLVRKRGVWIVTQTYTATRRAVAVMQERGSSVLFDVDVEVPNVARVGPRAEWWSETVHKPGWECHSGPNEVVLFMSGIYWQPRLVGENFNKLWEQKVKDVLAAGHPLQPVVVKTSGASDEPVYVRMSPHAVGEVPAAGGVPRMEYYDYEDAPSDVEEDGEEP
ncbi:hypothetical protein BX600DRAFT_471553 [Xylariales sp. PMI_506]|nr:hypothetical protein BX600DRAFT_471553 [Xylariales sp. PMI_506]